MVEDHTKSQDKISKDQKKIKDQNTTLSKENDKVQNQLTEAANKCEQYQIDLK